jgi:hypothetical protein
MHWYSKFLPREDCQSRNELFKNAQNIFQFIQQNVILSNASPPQAFLIDGQLQTVSVCIALKNSLQVTTNLLTERGDLLAF